MRMLTVYIPKDWRHRKASAITRTETRQAESTGGSRSPNWSYDSMTGRIDTDGSTRILEYYLLEDVMRTSAVTRKGQVTIPAPIRKRLGLRQGDRVAFVDEDDRIVLKPVQNDVRAAFGLVKARRSVSLGQMDEAIRKRAGR